MAESTTFINSWSAILKIGETIANVDFAVLFDFSDNDFGLAMDDFKRLIILL